MHLLRKLILYLYLPCCNDDNTNRIITIVCKYTGVKNTIFVYLAESRNVYKCMLLLVCTIYICNYTTIG